jgi:lysozyme family protein
MADFRPAFERTLLAEGGYKLTNVAADRGGQTYAGISRKNWPNWSGWGAIDRGETPESETVRAFYLVNFWQVVRGDSITDQRIAEALYDYAVNAGPKVAIKIAQIVLSTTPDGVIGPRTLAALNAVDPQAFLPAYALAIVARYRDIVTRDRSQGKFLLGWINRALKVVA